MCKEELITSITRSELLELVDYVLYESEDYNTDMENNILSLVFYTSKMHDDLRSFSDRFKTVSRNIEIPDIEDIRNDVYICLCHLKIIMHRLDNMLNNTSAFARSREGHLTEVSMQIEQALYATSSDDTGLDQDDTRLDQCKSLLDKILKCSSR